MVVTEVSTEQGKCLRREIDGFGDGVSVLGVEVRLGCDCVERRPLVVDLSRPVLEVPAVDSGPVAATGEARADFVDALFRASDDVQIYHLVILDIIE